VGSAPHPNSNDGLRLPARQLRECLLGADFSLAKTNTLVTRYQGPPWQPGDRFLLAGPQQAVASSGRSPIRAVAMTAESRCLPAQCINRRKHTFALC